MKTLGIILYIIFYQTFLLSQDNFIISGPSRNNIEAFYDIKNSNDQYFCLRYDLNTNDPDSSNSSLLIYDKIGSKLLEKQIGGSTYKCFQILTIDSNYIEILGSIKSDSCASILTISKYNYLTDSLVQISRYEFCNNQVLQKAKITRGLYDSQFVEGYYSSQSNFFFKFILQLDSNQNLTKVFDSLGVYTHLSIDFSRKGYVIKDNSLCDFYDYAFNYRKQRYNIGEGFEPSAHSTHIPFDRNFILEQVKKPNGGPPNGVVIRLIDSSLAVQKFVTISPPGSSYIGFIDLPFFGGLNITEDSSLWIAGSFGYSPQIDSNYYNVTKLDKDLKVICTHFLGFDAIYRLFGTAISIDGGLLVYGWKLSRGGIINSGDEEAFAIKLGPNCEFPTTSTSDPDTPLISISAYPNPGINFLTFSVQGFDPATLRVEMIDEMGRLLFSATNLTHSIQVPDLPAGQYFYRILQGDRLLGVGGWVKQ